MKVLYKNLSNNYNTSKRYSQLQKMTSQRQPQPQPPARGRVQSETLESSLLRLITDHQTTSLKLREQTDRYKKEAVKSAYKVSDLLVEAVNGGVEECYVNEKRIEVEIRALKSTVLRFGKNIDQWLVSTHAINSAVKEIGDFENWMKTMELDCKSIATAISNIHRS